MQAIFDLIIEQLKKQGLTVLLLFGLTYFFYSENKKLVEEMSICNKQMIELYQKNQKDIIEMNYKSLQALDRNTEAFKEFKEKRK